MTGKKKKDYSDVITFVIFGLFFIGFVALYTITESTETACILILLIASILAVLAGIYRFRQKIFGVRGVDVNKIRWQLEDSDPYEFEELVADMFKRLGYQSVETTKKSGDVGADIIMKRKGINYVVQVKKYAEGNKIGRPELQQLQGSAQHYRAQGLIFVTYGFFSSAAMEYAKQHGIELIDHNELLKLMRRQGTVTPDAKKNIMRRGVVLAVIVAVVILSGFLISLSLIKQFITTSS